MKSFADMKKDLSIFVYHGIRDDVIPYSYAKEKYDGMIESGFKKLECHYDPVLDHSISFKEIRAVRNFLAKLMK